MLEPGVKNSNGVGRIRLFKGVELRRREAMGEERKRETEIRPNIKQTPR